MGSNDQFISCHVLGCVDAMLGFIHAVGLLKLAVLVPVHACTQQITLVFVCGMYDTHSSVFVVPSLHLTFLGGGALCGIILLNGGFERTKRYVVLKIT